MKEQLESTFSKSSLKPIHRTKIGTHDVFIADGFVEPEQLPMIQRKFGGAIPAGQMGRDTFPHGCWATIWMTHGKIASRGGLALCNPDHDSMSESSKQKARINFAVNAARDALIGTKLH
jgi:hypothetical protein